MKEIFFFLLLTTTSLFAQKPGTLDKTFGRNGRQWDTLGQYPFYHLMQVQPDDKIVIGGIGFLEGSGIKTFRIERSLKDGRPDYAFGDSGKVLIEFHFSDNEYNHASSVTCLALQPDGKIVAGGYYSNRSGFYYSFVVVRLLPDGTIDSSFGTNGFARPHIPQCRIGAGAMAVQADGKILFGGTCEQIINDRLFYIARLLPDGNPDGSFGEKGFVIEGYGETEAIALQPDGKIVAGGTKGLYWEEPHLQLRRYNVDGTPDRSFHKRGWVDTALIPYANHFSDMALQPDGNILVAANGTYLYRFTKSGYIDMHFGMAGTAVNAFPNPRFPGTSNGTKVLVSNGRIYLTGNGNTYPSKNGYDVWLLAYNMNGTIDSAFANGGLQTADFGSMDYIGSAGLQSDGKIILYGLTNVDQTYQVRSLLRYYGYPEQMVTMSSEQNSHAAVSAGLSSVYMYPNPARDYVVITGLPASLNTTVMITDMSGKIAVVYHTGNALQNRFDISRLKAGIYYVQSTIAGKMERMKFLKE